MEKDGRIAELEEQLEREKNDREEVARNLTQEIERIVAEKENNRYVAKLDFELSYENKIFQEMLLAFFCWHISFDEFSLIDLTLFFALLTIRNELKHK